MKTNNQGSAIWLALGSYVVRDQNALRDAITHHISIVSDELGSYLTDKSEEPLEYPSLVTLEYEYCGYPHVKIRAEPLTSAIGKSQEKLKALGRALASFIETEPIAPLLLKPSA